MKLGQAIVRAQSRARDARLAAAQFHAAVAQPDTALVIFFCSADYDLDVLAEEMRRLFVGLEVVGCATAGGIGPEGCGEHSLSGMSFPADSFAAAGGGIDHLQLFDVARAATLTQVLMQRLEHVAPTTTADNSFALLLVDGLSVLEEPLTRALRQGLGYVPLVGGSAGDGIRFGATYVYYEGAFHADAAALILVSTPLPFQTLKIEHFIPTGLW